QRRAFGPDDVETAVSTYNLACVAAHEGKRDEAFSLLREVIDHGLLPSLGLGIENDSDLQSLHGDPRFRCHRRPRQRACRRSRQEAVKKETATLAVCREAWLCSARYYRNVE